MSKRKALAIGIDEYPQNSLRNCVNDAEEISLILDSKEYSFDVVTLYNEKAARRKVMSELKNLFDGNPEFVVFYFAGHGYSNDLGTYLVCIDGDDIDLGVDLEFLRKLVIAKSREDLSIVIILDCCHSGAASIRGTNQINARQINYTDIGSSLPIIGTGNVLIAACRPDEYAYEEPSVNHGIFTYYMLEGMYGDAADHEGKITIPRLYDYISYRFKNKTSQVPVFKGDIIGTVVLGKDLKPRDNLIPSDEVNKIEQTAENLINEHIQTSTFDIASWDRNGHILSCKSLQPKLRWFDRQSRKYPILLKTAKFKSAYTTAKTKLADLGQLKEGLNTEYGLVTEKLGAGTFGTVWKIQTLDNILIAFKAYHPLDLDNPEKLSRFDRGYRAMAQLDHPHIVKVRSFSECPIGFSMDYIEGTNLRNFAHMELTLEDVLFQLLTVGETLKHAHSRNVLHRDVKPENIIIKFDECTGVNRYRPFLTDFDLAWFTTATQFTKEGVGSLIYASPEQLSKPQSNAAHSPTVDVYSFGQLLFYFICRRDPVPVFSDNARVLRETVSAWSLVEPAEKIVKLYELCTEVLPGNRIQDFREICDWIFDVTNSFSSHMQNKYIGYKNFQKELSFSVIGLSPELQIADNEFFSKTGRYKIVVEFLDGSKISSNITIRIFSTSPPVISGAASFKDVRTLLNKRVDSSIGQYKNVTRHSGKEGVYNISLIFKGISMDAGGIEYTRKVLMRTLDCLEAG